MVKIIEVYSQYDENSLQLLMCHYSEIKPGFDSGLFSPKTG